MSLSDDEYVARVVSCLAHWRARNAAFGEAVKNIKVDPVHEAVIAVFDKYGDLYDLYIDPTAMTHYTNTELEEIITEALQQTRRQVHAQTMELFARYVNPDDPRFEPDILGEPYVALPEDDPHQPQPPAEPGAAPQQPT